MDSRLPEKMADKIVPVPNSGCWLWLGAHNDQGYGVVYVGTGRHDNRMEYVHRRVYLLLVGPIPDGLLMDHLCRTPGCCNPAHLEAVTPSENIVRGDGPGLAAERQTRKTHCPHGHPYSGDNLRLDKKGNRLCITCRRQSDRERKRLSRALKKADQRPEMIN